MKKTKGILIPMAFVLVLSLAFCLVFIKLPEMEVSSDEDFTTQSTEESVTHIHYMFAEATTEMQTMQDTTEESETSTTEKQTTKKKTTTKKQTSKPETTGKPTTAKKPVTTKATTTAAYSTKYNIQDMEDRLVNECWYFYDDDCSYKCTFFRDGSYKIYNDNECVTECGYYCIDGNNLYLFNQCGDIISKMIYDTTTKEFYSENYKPETTTKSTTRSTTKPQAVLESSDAVWVLWDAVACYDAFINTTTYNLDYDFFGEYITCSHCGGEAFLVKNYDSVSELYDYIDKYLTGDSKEVAELYVKETVDNGMFTECGGNLYVCGCYNEKGYCGMNYSSIRIVSENSDGTYRIAVDDLDNEETYYLSVYYIDGEFKIG